MTIHAVYEQYRHLDPRLRDLDWIPRTMHGEMLRECWVAICEEVNRTVTADTSAARLVQRGQP